MIELLRQPVEVYESSVGVAFGRCASGLGDFCSCMLSVGVETHGVLNHERFEWWMKHGGL